ncbi:MAG: hypothetical protein QNJ46_19400 [Leptolyngbyaceae cyanobacterium MO_188.B28]|nr:hypothetical protein [Leptolyngbyaceae cyanobacterium MO_188.B28]
MSSLAVEPTSHLSPCPPAWSTIRFRRAREKKGWALLGIPHTIYPLVAVRLFERRARLISQHQDGPFISLLFEASPALAANLACVFPAPPGCEVLKIAESGDRILSGKAAKSSKALSQRVDPIDVAEIAA